LETVFLGRMILLFVGFYIYEKAIQRYDPLLRMPWEWDAGDTKFNKVLKRQKSRKARPNHLRVVK